MVHKHSQLGYSLINEIDWHSSAAKGSRIKTVWRCVLKNVYIIFGRDLVKQIKSLM